MITCHKPNEQFNFKERDCIQTDSFTLYRDNRFTKKMINNRHDLKMTTYNNAGYGYQIFYGQFAVGSIWFLNQVTSTTTYVRVSRYESYRSGYFIAVLSELNDLLNDNGYSLFLKTKITFAQEILSMNFEPKLSKRSAGKRGVNDRSKASSSVTGLSYDLSVHVPTYSKWHDEVSCIEA